MKKLLNSLLVVFLLWGNVGVYAESVSDDNALDGSTAEVITDNQELGATTEEANSEETTEQSEWGEVFVDEAEPEEPAPENTVESLDNEDLSDEPSFEESTTTETSEETEPPIEIEETKYVDLLNEGEEHQDFTLSMIYFNSRVDNGRTALNHNTPAILDLDTLSGTLTLQMNYEGNTLSKNYAPGEFTFKVYGLEKFGLKSPTIAGNLFNYTHHVGTYNPDLNIVEDDYYIFTNKTTLNEGTNVSGMVQMSYTIGSGQQRSPYDDSSGTIHAELNDIPTDELYFEFNLKKTTSSASMYPSKIGTYNGLGDNPEDYYWIRYSGNYFNNYSDGILNPLSASEYAIITLPDNVKLFAYQQDSAYPIAELFPTSTSDGFSYYTVPRNNDSGGSGYTTFYFVGYPKTEYDVTDTVSISGDWYGVFERQDGNYTNYGDPAELLASKTTTARISNYIFVPGNGISWNFYVGDSDNKLTSDAIVRNDLASYAPYSTLGVNDYGKYNLIYSVDKIAIQQDDLTYTMLDESDYYFSSINVPTSFKDLNSVLIPANSAEVSLYVKHRDATDFVLYGSYPNKASGSTRTISFTDTDVTQFYWVLRGIDGTLSLQSPLNYTTTEIVIHREDGTFKTDGNVLNIARLEIEDYDTGEILNIPSAITDYPENAQLLDIYNDDLNTFGHYVMRKEVLVPIKAAQFSGAGTIDGYLLSSNPSYSTYNILVSTAYYAKYTTMMGVKGYDIYTDFSTLISVPSLEQIYADTLEWLDSNPPSSNYKASYVYSNVVGNNKQFATMREYVDYLFNHITMEKFENIDGNGTTRMHMHFDFTDEPLELPTVTTNSTLNLIVFVFKTNIYNTDIIDYGSHISGDIYHKPALNGESLYFYGGSSGSTAPLFNTRCRMEGYKYVDTADIDNDADVTEQFFHESSTGELAIAFDAQQELSKLTSTDKNFWTTGAATVSADTDYSYRLRVRTASNGMTNLVLYDYIEKYIPDDKEHWVGKFRGIDLTRTSTQGYTPTVYYATTQEIGALGEDPQWLPYDTSVDSDIVESLAFDFGDQIIQPNSIVSVDILMHSPEGNSDYYTYNAYEATWKRVDPATDYVFPDEETLESNVPVISLNDPISDYKTINVVKVWEGENGNTSRRPTEITINLYQDGNLYTTKTGDSSTNWNVVFSGLPAFTDKGHEYEYTIEEVPVDDYITTYDGYTITNTYHPAEYVPISKKSYTGEYLPNATLQIRGTMADNTPITPIEWTTTGVQDIKKLYPGTYTLTEIQAPDGYTAAPSITFTVLEGGQIKVNNEPVSELIMYDNELINLGAAKNWNDTGHESVRPSSVTVNLKQNGQVIDSQTLNAGNNWSYTFENLLKYSDVNTEYTYVIEETPMTNYTPSYEEIPAANALELKFNNSSSTESVSYDYVEIYYNDSNNVLRKLGRWGGKSDLKDKVIQIPALDFYLYWRSDSSVNDYGFSIDYIKPITLDDTVSVSTGTLPNYSMIELSGSTYPETEHSYTNNDNKLWHYTGTGASNKIISILNTWDPPFTTLTITNKVEGSLGDKTKDFHYTIFADVESLEMTRSTIGSLISPVTDPVDVTFVDGNYEFTLKHNERIDFQVPVGMEVRIVQESTDYTTTVNREPSLVFENTIDEATTVNYINRLDGAVPTEISAPVVGGVVLLLTGIMYFIIYRRKRYI